MIPSFRQLLKIEKLDWALFKKYLPSKKDKQAFDKVFENARLYTSYLGNSSNPIVLESVIMGSLLHNYKVLMHINKEDSAINQDSLKKELLSLFHTKPEGKILFYRFSKKWRGVLYALHKEDRELLLKMILELCSYGEDICRAINIEDYQSPVDYYFFLLAIVNQQKLLERLNAGNVEKDITLLNFMS